MIRSIGAQRDALKVMPKEPHGSDGTHKFHNLMFSERVYRSITNA